jgi:hypothetical protein
MITGHSLQPDICLPTWANLLLTGPYEVADAFLESIRLHLQEPVVIVRGGEPLALPSAPVGTLFLADVSALTLEEQCRVHDWLGECSSHTQVISTSATSLMPMVAAGSFLEALYYRLNTVYIDITALSSE